MYVVHHSIANVLKRWKREIFKQKSQSAGIIGKRKSMNSPVKMRQRRGARKLAQPAQVLRLAIANHSAGNFPSNLVKSASELNSSELGFDILRRGLHPKNICRPVSSLIDSIFHGQRRTEPRLDQATFCHPRVVGSPPGTYLRSVGRCAGVTSRGHRGQISGPTI